MLLLNAYRENSKIDLNAVERAIKTKLEIFNKNDAILAKNSRIEAELWLLYIKTAKLNKKNILKLVKRTLNFLKTKNLAADTTLSVAWELFRSAVKADKNDIFFGGIDKNGVLLDALMACCGFKLEFKETSIELKSEMALKVKISLKIRFFSKIKINLKSI